MKPRIWTMSKYVSRRVCQFWLDNSNFVCALKLRAGGQAVTKDYNHFPRGRIEKVG